MQYLLFLFFSFSFTLIVMEGVKDYNATIGFYWSPYLVESSADHVGASAQPGLTVRINSIEKHARHWSDADILIFDTFLWWALKIESM